ncbi:uncharacterized protein LOC113238806 isoform X1 [Hyposmocoma kahamanoa]|uniref:uncharacterized protein LOC113238806 isoform X1 n=1 Tax=Hyposmocoma kahamanoa TaxID=1477025 RepID=UPI000E6D611F|nr:uncharacterized protein LOC113238806 isoform X1 [Hyposmocoma kahamanoa]
MKLHCSKYQHCVANDEKVCGYNEDDTYMAVFENYCALYRMNCKGHGFFTPIRIEFCRAKLKYDTEHANDTFEWVHVLRNDNTSAFTTIALYLVNETAFKEPNTRRHHHHRHKKRKYRTRKRKRGHAH